MRSRLLLLLPVILAGCASGPNVETKHRMAVADAVAAPGCSGPKVDQMWAIWRGMVTAYRPVGLSALRDSAGHLLFQADEMKRKGCLDEADRGYREVVSTYVGNGYAAYRQRAEIGIEDIRRARGM